jgi:membrane associated rhomboid family serine protease
MTWFDLNRIDSWMEHAEDRLGKQFGFLSAWITLLAIIELADQLGPWELDAGGIRPRSFPGLAGIFAAPFLHAGWSHLLSNAIPLAGLAWLTLFAGWRRFWIVTSAAVLGSGIAVWATGPTDRIHLGASALVFGYLGHLLIFGILRKSLPWIITGAAAALCYGGLLGGLRMEAITDGSVSWTGHATGFLSGMIVAAFPSPRQ